MVSVYRQAHGVTYGDASIRVLAPMVPDDPMPTLMPMPDAVWFQKGVSDKELP